MITQRFFNKVLNMMVLQFYVSRIRLAIKYMSYEKILEITLYTVLNVLLKSKSHQLTRYPL